MSGNIETKAQKAIHLYRIGARKEALRVFKTLEKVTKDQHLAFSFGYDVMEYPSYYMGSYGQEWVKDKYQKATKVVEEFIADVERSH